MADSDDTLSPKARQFLDRHIRNPTGQRARPRLAPMPQRAQPRVIPPPQRAQPRIVGNPAEAHPATPSPGGVGQGVAPQRPQPRQAGLAPAAIRRQFDELEAAYRLKADDIRADVAAALVVRFDEARRALAEGRWDVAAPAVASLDRVMQAIATRPRPQTVASPSVPQGAAAQPAPQTSSAQQGKADLVRQMVALDADLIKKNTNLKNLAEQSRIGGDLKILQQRIKQYLDRSPLTDADVKEAKGLFTELKIKADFIATRQRQVEGRRGKLDEYTQLLMAERANAPAVSADALMADKSLKAGDTFKAFCATLKLYETATAGKASTADQVEQSAAALRTSIDKYLAHYDKFSKSERAKAENQRKHAAVQSAKAVLERDDMIRATAALKAKPDWSRQDEAKATELYLQMMLELSELDKAPRPKNLKEGGDELVMQIKNENKKSKLVVKPISREIAVDGFVSGGGGGREMLANVMADKLQEMLGIELNVPITKVVSIDGGKIGMEPGTKVTCSAQAWSKDTQSIQEQIDAKFGARDPESKAQGFSAEAQDVGAVLVNIPKAEVQNKAIFDLISLHCDRHAGNFMVDADNRLVPIDHGNILPTKAGLIGRKEYLGSSHAILKNSAAAQEKLDPELIERLERLNVNELIDTTRAAQLEMRKATPDADKGDLDEGLQNSRRSIEFLKVAANRLTLAQIYDAYSNSQHDIFFSDESHKQDAFERAIRNQLGGQGAAVADLRTLYLDAKKDQVDWRAVRSEGEALGWFQGLEDSDFNTWRRFNADRILRIVKERIQHRPPAPRPVPKLTKAEAMFNGKPVDPSLMRSYLELGGDEMFLRIWPSPEDHLMKEKLDRRVKILQGLSGAELL